MESLNDGDRFEVLRFSTEVEPLFGRLAEAAKDTRHKASDFVLNLKAIGGTALDEAFVKALALRPDRGDRPFVVIFLTDGRPTIGNTDDKLILGHVQAAAGQTRVFVFGLGSDVNTHLLDKITAATRAFSQYVLSEEDIEVKVSSFFAKIKEPVLANPALTFTGDIRATKLYPAPLPDLFRGDQLVLVGRYSGQGDAAAVLGGSVNGATKKFSYDVRFPGTSPENDFIARLWATRRVGWLLDEIRLHGENAELKDEVTDLARKYGIVTPYTAYLIVEDETKRGVAVNVQTLPQLRQDAAAYSMAGQAYDSLAKEKSGAAAVAGARYGLAMQQAAGASSLRGAQLEARRALVAAAPSLPSGGADVTVVDRVTQYTQQQRCVGGRTFFQNGRQWTEAQVQQQSQARKVRVAFGSPDYFELLEKQPQTRAWLALGQNVQFVLHGIVYEIFDDTGKNKS